MIKKQSTAKNPRQEIRFKSRQPVRRPTFESSRRDWPDTRRERPARGCSSFSYSRKGIFPHASFHLVDTHWTSRRRARSLYYAGPGSDGLHRHHPARDRRFFSRRLHRKPDLGFAERAFPARRLPAVFAWSDPVALHMAQDSAIDGANTGLS